MAGQQEGELYSLKGANTVPYRYAHPDIVVVDQQYFKYGERSLCSRAHYFNQNMSYFYVSGYLFICLRCAS